MTKRVEIHYDGSLFRVTGWLPSGEALFSIPRGGQVEVCLCKGQVEVICRDRRGLPRSMRVEEAV